MQRNIGKLTGALLVFASFLFAIGFVRNNMPDPPPTDPGVLPVAPDDDPVVSEEARARRAQIDTLVQEGNALFSQQRYLDAIRKYEAVQRMHPSNATATKMGYIACELLVAQSLYETIARRDTTRTERGEVRESSLAKAANAISGKGSLRAARADLDEALGYFPEDEDLLAARQQVERERRNRDRWSDQNQRQKLLDRLEKLFAAAMDTLARGDDISAYAELEQVLAADSERETEWYWKAEEQQGVIKADRAKRGGQTFRSAVTAKRNGDYLSARSQLRETMRLDPFHASARRHLEEVQSKLDKLALQLWSEAEIYEQTNQSDLAIGKYHEVVKYSAETSAPLAQKAQARIDALMRR